MVWQDGWKQATLRAAGIPVTQFALDVLEAWQQSTPTQPWTNNPLGIPAREFGFPTALNTPYAVVTDMPTFRDVFKRFTQSKQGAQILYTLIAGESFSDAWREVHGLGWPGNRTETDYPSGLLDLVTEKYRTKLQTRKAGDRKTAGKGAAAPAVHEAVRQQAMALNYAAQAFNSGTKAIEFLVRRLG